MKRRALLQGIGIAPAFTLVPSTGTAAAPGADIAPQAAVFNQQAYFSLDGTGANYAPPAGNVSTVEYRASLTDEEFLRRHWFS